MSQPSNIPAMCFIALLIFGIMWIGIGLVLVPALPYFQLDAVLSPEELSDQEKMDATLKLLKAASGNQWFLWVTAGAVVVILSAIGLQSCRNPRL